MRKKRIVGIRLEKSMQALLANGIKRRYRPQVLALVEENVNIEKRNVKKEKRNKMNLCNNKKGESAYVGPILFE